MPYSRQNAALRVDVAKQRLQAIQGGGKAGFGRLGGFKFLPEGAHFPGLVGGQEAKDAPGGEFLTRGLERAGPARRR